MWTYAHPGFVVHQWPALEDNYVYLMDDGEALACVDPADLAPVRQACAHIGRPLTHILNTHHHWDHTDANLALRDSYGCAIVGFARDAARIPGITRQVEDGETVVIGRMRVQVMFTPGHTRGHVCYLLDDALFCGDTLFGAGCGRLFEGTPEIMWKSLNRLMQLPVNTRVYCAHEYTLNNLDFCLACVEDDARIRRRRRQAAALRQRNQPTIPSTLGEEQRTNPMLLPADAGFRARYAARHRLADDAQAVFAHIRAARDRW